MNIARVLLTRIFYAAILLIAVLVLNFSLMHLAPGDVAAVFAQAEDGSDPNTQAVVVAIVPTLPGQTDFVVLDNIPTFPDLSINQVGVAADDQGRITVVYTDLPAAAPARVQAQQIDGLTGLPIDGPFDVTDDGHAVASVALLDPAGNRLVVPTSDFLNIRGNIIDTTGATPVVLPEFPISTTPAGFANLNTAVAADPDSGAFTVAWENLTDLPGDPVNVYARRFDAQGNPIGNDFVVNTTTADAQGQPAVAYGPQGLSAIAWAGDAGSQADALDVFLQVYDADGNPLDGEIRVNTFTENVQDLPAVRFLPQNDAQGRPQVAVVWRDSEDFGGVTPRGTGTSYRCFSIEGIEDPASQIFADGFESGDTSSWSASQP